MELPEDDTKSAAVVEPSAPALEPAPPAESVPEVEVTITASKLDDIVSTWVTDRIFNSPLSRNTEGYNHLVQELPALKAAILKGD